MPDPFLAVPVLAVLLPFAFSWTLTALLVRWSPRLGLVDLPGDRKVHTQPTPRGGGLAIYAALVTGSCCLWKSLPGHFFTLLIIGFVIVVLGLVDDWKGLPWQLRLGVQTAVALSVVGGWHADLGWWWGSLAVLWIVALINAFNMLDNMDALSAGVAVIAAFFLAWVMVLVAGLDGNWQPILPELLFVGGALGFLWFNRPPARIFMGDAGSTFLGFFLGVRSLEFAVGAPAQPYWRAVPICILAVPLYDMTSVVALRLWQRRSPFHADKQHLSHRLVELGLSRSAAVGVIYLLALASGLAGVAICFLTASGVILFGVQIGVWWLAVAWIEYLRHFYRKDRAESV